MSHKRDESKDYGPGNTHWFVKDDGEICRCRYNDASWVTTTHKNLNNLRPWEFIMLMRLAYETGAVEARERIKRELGL